MLADILPHDGVAYTAPDKENVEACVLDDPTDALCDGVGQPLRVRRQFHGMRSAQARNIRAVAPPM